jgi:hypothetical protein
MNSKGLMPSGFKKMGCNCESVLDFRASGKNNFYTNHLSLFQEKDVLNAFPQMQKTGRTRGNILWRDA